MRIFIAAGHGGGDPGAVAQGTNERDEAIKVVDGVYDILKKYNSPNYEFIKIDNNLALQDTVASINNLTKNVDEDKCLEVHFNAANSEQATGTEIYYGNLDWSEKIYKTVVNELKLTSRGVKKGMYLYFNNFTRPASALLELGFITNITDLKRVRENGALAVSRAILAALGIPEVTVGETPIKNAENKHQLLQNIMKLIAEIKTLIERFKNS